MSVWIFSDQDSLGKTQLEKHNQSIKNRLVTMTQPQTLRLFLNPWEIDRKAR
jgi:hypothetical protein